MKARAIKSARAQAADILWAADTDVCEIPRITLATLLDDVCRFEDDLTRAREQIRLMELWRVGWEQYLQTLKPSATSSSGKLRRASFPSP